jgi:hypothetical protein
MREYPLIIKRFDAKMDESSFVIDYMTRNNTMKTATSQFLLSACHKCEKGHRVNMKPEH